MATRYKIATQDRTETFTNKTLGSGCVNANLTGPITSVGNTTSIASQTGTGTKFVVDTSPTLVTPNIGAATGTSLILSGTLTVQGEGPHAFSGTSNFVSNTLVVSNTSSRVGIGVLAPAVKLEVLATTEQLRLSYDATHVTSFTVGSTGALTLTPQAGTNFNLSLSTTGDFAVNTNQLYVDTSAASVGIGQATLAARLHVTGAGATSSTFSFLAEDSSGNDWLKVRDDGSITIGNSSVTGSASFIQKPTETFTLNIGNGTSGTSNINFLNPDGTTENTGVITFGTKQTQAGGVVERIRIDSSGNVGIGTTAPSDLLHVTKDTNNLGVYFATHSIDQATQLNLQRSRGTLASPTNVANGDVIGFLIGQSYSNGYLNTGQITFEVDGTFTAGQRPPSRIVFTTNVANAGGTEKMRIDSSGNVTPNGAGSQNFGDGTNYWNDISYKTLTDRGCLGSFDEGVELQDGSLVSDMEAIEAIQVDPTQLTVYGVPRFDYSTMPKAVYKPVPIATEDIYEDVTSYSNETTERVLKFKKGEKMGADGAETTALLSIMLGALKELNTRIINLEAKL